MVARVWKGETRATDLDAYTKLLEDTGRADALATAGNRGVQILRRVVADRAEFVFVSLWESLDAIRGFAGPDLERARYYSEDERYLVSFPEYVEHYEVVD
jgi:heme-degrading monooxygenase HmoA